MISDVAIPCISLLLHNAHWYTKASSSPYNLLSLSFLLPLTYPRSSSCIEQPHQTFVVRTFFHHHDLWALQCDQVWDILGWECERLDYTISTIYMLVKHIFYVSLYLTLSMNIRAFGTFLSPKWMTLLPIHLPAFFCALKSVRCISLDTAGHGCMRCRPWPVCDSR